MHGQLIRAAVIQSGHLVKTRTCVGNNNIYYCGVGAADKQ